MMSKNLWVQLLEERMDPNYKEKEKTIEIKMEDKYIFNKKDIRYSITEETQHSDKTTYFKTIEDGLKYLKENGNRIGTSLDASICFKVAEITDI